MATAGVSAAATPAGNMLAAANRLWLSTLMNVVWAVTLVGLSVLLIHLGALGLAIARLCAYSIQAGWSLWFAWYFLVEPHQGQSASEH
jgi:O-antigen/teichoic acid export membrane protein